MDASKEFCPNMTCSARGKIGEGNIRIHSYNPARYRCCRCNKTFSARRGTMMEGLRTPRDLVMIVVTLVAYGCPTQAIVHAYGLDERTVAAWRDRAGKHCQQVHEALVVQGHLDLQHVQIDEIRVKGYRMIAWMGMAIMVSTRLWRAGSGESRARSNAGRSCVAPSSRLLPALARDPGLYRWVGSLPKQHHAGVSRKSEKDGRTGKSMFRDLARPVYCHRGQACGEETSR
jgi:transposase-like protein